MIIPSFLERAKRLYPKKEAVVCEERRFTYQEFYERSKRLAFFLQKRGIKKGDVVSILHFNCHFFLEAYFATAFIGAILNPINVRLLAKEILYILENAESKLLITHSKYKDELLKIKDRLPFVLWTDRAEKRIEGEFYEEALISERPHEQEKIGEDDIAHLYYTSGTTGKPKGVMLTHKNVVTHSLLAIAEFNITDKDVWLHAAPLFHLADAWATFAFTFMGAKHIILNEFIVEKLLGLIEKEKVTITNMVPTMYNMIVNYQDLGKFDLSSMRLALSGGAPCSPELARKIMEKFGCEYVQTYGMTETSPYLTVSILKDHLKKLPKKKQFEYKVKTGREFLGVELKVLREDGREVERNGKEVGEIVVRGDTVMKGYWRLEEETKKTLRDGWLYTGDLATIDEEGYVNIVDRKKDMIITGGENVYSIEVENVLSEHPAIFEVAVIGTPDEKWGEVVTAFVVLKEGQKLTEKEIIEFAKERIAHFKAPKRVFFLSHLPKTGSGKIAKAKLKELYETIRKP